MSDDPLEHSVFADMSHLEETITNDPTGERARAIVGYFKSVVDATQRMLTDTNDESQRHLLSRLLRGFEAAQRIIRHVWETIHGHALVV